MNERQEAVLVSGGLQGSNMFKRVMCFVHEMFGVAAENKPIWQVAEEREEKVGQSSEMWRPVSAALEKLGVNKNRSSSTASIVGTGMLTLDVRALLQGRSSSSAASSSAMPIPPSDLTAWHKVAKTDR